MFLTNLVKSIKVSTSNEVGQSLLLLDRTDQYSTVLPGCSRVSCGHLVEGSGSHPPPAAPSFQVCHSLTEPHWLGQAQNSS
jgi:hypothetical protein